MAAYRFDMYHRPEHVRQPVLLETQRISAQDDSDAIFKAEQLFLVHDSHSVTGFMLSSLGLRRAHDHVVHNFLKRTGAFRREKTDTPEKDETAEEAAPAPVAAAGEEVAEVPPCIGF